MVSVAPRIRTDSLVWPTKPPWPGPYLASPRSTLHSALAGLAIFHSFIHAILWLLHSLCAWASFPQHISPSPRAYLSLPPSFRPLLVPGLSLFPSNIFGPFPCTMLGEGLPLPAIFPGPHSQWTFSWVWPPWSFGEKEERTRNQGILPFLHLGQQVWQPLFLLHGSMLLTGQAHHASSFFLMLQPWPLLIYILPLSFQLKVGCDFWLLLISELLHCPLFGSQFFSHWLVISLFSSPSVSNASVSLFHQILSDAPTIIILLGKFSLVSIKLFDNTYHSWEFTFIIVWQFDQCYFHQYLPLQHIPWLFWLTALGN